MNNQTISRPKQAFVGLQMLFVAFGALVLVPLITGLDPNTALLTAGVGTLLFQLCTKRQVPILRPPLLVLLRQFSMVCKNGELQSLWVV